MLVENDIDVDLVTLDTGRLFPQTYDLWAETEQRFGRRISAIYPQQDDVAALVDRHGINGFYRSRQARLSCCHVRTVEPLDRALVGTPEDPGEEVRHGSGLLFPRARRGSSAAGHRHSARACSGACGALNAR